MKKVLALSLVTLTITFSSISVNAIGGALAAKAQEIQEQNEREGISSCIFYASCRCTHKENLSPIDLVENSCIHITSGVCAAAAGCAVAKTSQSSMVAVSAGLVILAGAQVGMRSLSRKKHTARVEILGSISGFAALLTTFLLLKK